MAKTKRSKTPVVTKADDIKSLPWKGNHHSDMKLFFACDDFVKSSAKAGKRAEARKAIRLMCLYGQGSKKRVSDADLTFYLENA